MRDQTIRAAGRLRARCVYRRCARGGMRRWRRPGQRLDAPGGSAVALRRGAGNTVVRIYVPGRQSNEFGDCENRDVAVSARRAARMPCGAGPNVQTTATPLRFDAAAAVAGSQVLAINVSGPTTISQTLSVGPNSGGCVPSPGGSTCQLALSLPARNLYRHGRQLGDCVQRRSALKQRAQPHFGRRALTGRRRSRFVHERPESAGRNRSLRRRKASAARRDARRKSKRDGRAAAAQTSDRVRPADRSPRPSRKPRRPPRTCFT